MKDICSFKRSKKTKQYWRMLLSSLALIDPRRPFNNMLLLGAWQRDLQLHERPGGFRTSAGERHRLSVLLLTLKINNRHPRAHSRVSVSSQSDAWGTDLYSSQPDQENLDLMSDPRRDESTSESIRCSRAHLKRGGGFQSLLEKSLSPPCGHLGKALQLELTIGDFVVCLLIMLFY